MRVIKQTRVREYWQRHRRAKPSLELWLAKTKAAKWKSFNDVRQTFGSADEVKVDSGRKTVVFNIGGNNFRLITAIHYDKKKVFVLRFLTHVEYDKDFWKKEL